MEKVASIAAAIVGVALISVLVSSPNTAKVFTAAGSAFANSIRAAQGR